MLKEIKIRLKIIFGRKVFWYLAGILILIFLAVLGLNIFHFREKKLICPFVEKIETQKTEKIDDQKPAVIAGFLPSWNIAKKVKVYPESLSQLIYFGFEVSGEGKIIKQNKDKLPTPEWVYFRSGYFEDIKKRAKENKTKILVSFFLHSNKDIDEVISNERKRWNLIKEMVKVVEENELDGLDIDFEYIPATDFPTRQYFNVFLEELKKELKGKNSSLILSVDIYANAVINDNPYDIKKIGEITDQLIIMGYDFYRPSSSYAGPVAPLRSANSEASIIKVFRSLFEKVDKEKIVLGIPFYGYEWQTISANHRSAVWDNSGALATYKRVKDLIKNKQVEVNWDNIALSPWLVYKEKNKIKQIYYEDERSISFKIQLVKQSGIRGVAIWALGYEGDYLEPWLVIGEKLKPLK